MFPQQETEQLGAPLLRSEGEVEEFADLLLTSNRRMETSHSETMMNLSTGPMAIPGVRRTVFWALGIRTLADVLPAPLQMVVNSGKMSAIVFVGAYLFLIALWLPFWLLSFVVTEWGVYALVIGAVFLIGRGIIRMIAFPGSSNVGTFVQDCPPGSDSKLTFVHYPLYLLARFLRNRKRILQVFYQNDHQFSQQSY